MFRIHSVGIHFRPRAFTVGCNVYLVANGPDGEFGAIYALHTSEWKLLENPNKFSLNMERAQFAASPVMCEADGKGTKKTNKVKGFRSGSFKKSSKQREEDSSLIVANKRFLSSADVVDVEEQKGF